MSLCDGAKTRVRVGSAYLEEFKVKVSVHQGSVLLLLLLPTPSEGWGRGGRPWIPRSQATL